MTTKLTSLVIFLVYILIYRVLKSGRFQNRTHLKSEELHLRIRVYYRLQVRFKILTFTPSRRKRGLMMIGNIF